MKRPERAAIAGLLAFVFWVALSMALRADVITPIDAGTVSVLLPLTVNAGAGDQFHAHVDGDLAAYTSDLDIRYYNFFTGDDAGIPHVAGFPDWLSDVNNGKIAFTRTLSDGGWDIYVYDTTSQALTPVASSPSTHHRIWPSIGGNTVAFLDLGPWGTPDLPQILVADLADPSTAIRVTDTAQYEGYNSGVGVSPGGDVLVWDSCDFAAGDQTTCEIYKAVRSGASWVTSRITTNSFTDEFPRTDGTVISWVSMRDGEPRGEHLRTGLSEIGADELQLQRRDRSDRGNDDGRCEHSSVRRNDRRIHLRLEDRQGLGGYVPPASHQLR
jgi:hypothetical protein